MTTTNPKRLVPFYTCDTTNPDSLRLRGRTQPMDRVEIVGPTGYVHVPRCDIPWLIGVLVKEFGKSYERLPVEDRP